MNILVYSKKNWQLMLAGFLIAGFIIALPPLTKLGKNLFNLLSLVSILFVIFNRGSIRNLCKDEKFILSAVVVFLGWSILTYFFNGSPDRGTTFLWHRQFFVVMLIPIFLYLRKNKLPVLFYLIVIILSSIVIFGFSIKEIYVDAQLGVSTLEGYRVRGGMHPIQYGSIALILLCFLVTYPFFFKTEKWLKILLLILSVGLVASIIFSQARGVWVGLPIIACLWLFLYPSNLKNSYKYIFMAVVIAVISLSYFIKPVQQRVDTTINSIEAYYNSDSAVSHSRGTSLGTRFEMWKASWYIVKDNPVFGVGLGGYQEAAKEMAELHALNRSSYWFYHPHNQYFSEMASKGVPGLVIYIAMIWLFLRYYYKKLNSEVTNEKKFFAFMGLQLISLFAVFSLSDAVIEGKVMLLMFVVFNSIFLAMISDVKNTKVIRS